MGQYTMIILVLLADTQTPSLNANSGVSRYARGLNVGLNLPTSMLF